MDMEWKSEWFTQPNGEQIRIHAKEICAGPCPVHSPSDHPMKEFTLLFRYDRNMWERLCPHGIGHPDPDWLAFTKKNRGYAKGEGTHGCDGCCVRPKPKLTLVP